MMSRRVIVPLALMLLVTGPVLASVEAAARQPPPPQPLRTGVLVVPKGRTEGTIVYDGSLGTIYQAALQVADAQGDEVLADRAAGTITARVGRFRPDGSQLTLAVALSELPDRRTQVLVAANEPGPSKQPVGPAKAAIEVYVAALTAVLSGKQAGAGSRPLRLYVFTAPDGRDLKGRQESVDDLHDFLRPLPVHLVPVAAKQKAEVWLEVVRRVDGAGLTVRLTVPGTSYSTEWTEDSPRDVGLAEDIEPLVRGWLTANRERLVSGRRTQPLPAGRACAIPADPSASPMSPPSAKVKLFLGPAAATEGFVNFNPAFDHSYKDLCEEYKSERRFRSVLTPVTDRGEADLILEITYRNGPLSYRHAEIRAVLFVAGTDIRLELDGRTGAVPVPVDQTGVERPPWRSQANALLRQAVEWITANGPVLDKVRTRRVPARPERAGQS